MNIFKIKREERWLALSALLFFAFLNYMMVTYQYDLFTKGGNLGFWSIFVNHFHISGFDPNTYLTLSKWDVYYIPFRHPLLSFLWYPFAQLNMWLMQCNEFNYAVYIVAAVNVAAAFYSFILMFRTFREVMRQSWLDSMLLVTFFYGFSFIMLSVMVPDHFCFSLLMLTIVIYVTGRKMRGGLLMNKWQTALLFLFTAGVTLSNGIKVWLAEWFTNGRKFFAPANLIVAVVVPAALLWGVAMYQDTEYVQPRAVAGKIIEAKKMEKDSATFKRNIENIKKNDNSARVSLAKDGFMQWTNMSTSRSKSFVENLFGESVIFHEQYFLKDIHSGRPVFVEYRSPVNYVIEAVIILLLLFGCFCGWRSKFLWMLLSWFAFDMLIHFGLGFGLNEVYIMGAHWLFVIPIAIAFAITSLQKIYRQGLRVLLGALTAYLWIYNLHLLTSFFF